MSTLRDVVRRRLEIESCRIADLEDLDDPIPHRQPDPSQAVVVPEESADQPREPNHQPAIDDFCGAEAAEASPLEAGLLGVSSGNEYTPGRSGGETLAALVAAELDKQVTEALEQGFDHPLRVSLSLPDESFADLPARWPLLARGHSLAEALFGWSPIEALKRLLPDVGASGGLVSLDVSIVGRLHFYGVVIVPRHVTAADLDRRWFEATGAHEHSRPYELGKRVCELRSWPHVIAMHEALANGIVTDEAREHLHELRGYLSDDVRNTVSYALKGGDRSSYKRRMFVTAPEAIWSRPAHEWIVWSAALSSTAGLGLDSGSVSPAEASAVRNSCIDVQLEREPTCACCGSVLAMVRPAWPERIKVVRDRHGRETEVPAPVRVPRKDRRFCSQACRAKSSRAHIAAELKEAMTDLDRELPAGSLEGLAAAPAIEPSKASKQS